MINRKNLGKLTAGCFMMLAFSCSNGEEASTEVKTDEKTEEKVMEKEVLKEGEIPLEDFFKNAEKSGFAISPDGSHLAYLAPYEARKNVFVQKIGEKEAVRVTQEKDRDISGFFWATDNRLVYLKDNGGDENFYLVAVDKDGNNEKDLTKFDKIKTQIIDDLEGNPSEMIIGLNSNNPMLFDAYRINIETGDTTMVAKNPGTVMGWQTDHEGKIRIAVSTNQVDQTILYRKTESDPWTKVITTNFKDQFGPQFFDFDNGDVVYGTSNIGRDKAALVKFDLAKGKEIEELYSDSDNDIMGVGYSKKRKVLTSVRWYADKRKFEFFDEESKATYEKIKAHLPERLEVSVADVNKNEDKYIVVTYSDKSRGTYYFYDKTTDKIEKLADVSPWLEEDKMAEMKPIQYQSRDGLTIHGYLTLPSNKEAKNLPVVINPHGGPWARDYWGYNPEVQFLANRGYAVLQMNFRGSTTYGKEFWTKSFKQWGLTMQDDITDGVNWLIEQGIADKERIAIYGASYGGYATLAGLTNTPDVYACGVDYVGVSNLFTFMEKIPPYWKPLLKMMHQMVGDPVADSLMMAENSPALNADKIQVPLFVAQGANDPRVVKSESDQMVEALKERGITVDYMVKEDEGHGFRNEENKFDFYRAMSKFLATHLKNE